MCVCVCVSCIQVIRENSKKDYMVRVGEKEKE